MQASGDGTRHAGTSAVTTREALLAHAVFERLRRRHRRPVPAAASAAAAARAGDDDDDDTDFARRSRRAPQQAAADLANSTSCTLWTARRWLSTHSLRSSGGARCADVRLRCTRTLHCDSGYSATPTRSRTPETASEAHMERTLSPRRRSNGRGRGGGAGQRKQGGRRATGRAPATLVGLHRPVAASRVARGTATLAPSPLVPSWPRS